MKICVTAQGNTLDSQIDPQFGRSAYLLFIDSQTMQYTAVFNKSGNAIGGAGIATARMVLEQGAQVVITGYPGPNAMQVLTSVRQGSFLCGRNCQGGNRKLQRKTDLMKPMLPGLITIPGFAATYADMTCVTKEPNDASSGRRSQQ